MMPFKQFAAVPGLTAEIEVTGAMLAALTKVAATPALSDEERFEIACLRFIAARALHGAHHALSAGPRVDLTVRETERRG